MLQTFINSYGTYLFAPIEINTACQAAEAKQRDRELVRDIEEQSAARVSRTVPRKSTGDASVSAFVREQQQKKEEIDRMRKRDEETLKSLNSPLPSPGKTNSMRPVGLSPEPYRALDSITPTPPPPPPAPVPVAKSSSTPDLSLASLTMAKKSESTPPPIPSPPSPTPSSQRLNLFEMTKLKDDSQTTKQPPPRKNPPPAKKRVVRQKVPLFNDDDDDDDDDDTMLSGAPGLTVADALKQQRNNGGGGGTSPGANKNLSADEKAKAWGIDISKFT